MAREVKSRLRGACALVCLALAACGPAPLPRAAYSVIGGDPKKIVPVPDVSQAEWTLARQRFEGLRAELPRRNYVERVQVGVVDPRSGQVFRARGAVAVSPDRAARLLLLGPAGTTALDLWVTRDQYRLAIPSIKLQRRGSISSDQTAGLPIGFLRWWFLGPLSGNLLLARSSDKEAIFLLRDGDATITLRTNGSRFTAVRREHGLLEGIDWTGRGLSPRAGARGLYIDGRWGVRVQVQVEAVLNEEPDPAAFLDPDEKGTEL